MLAVINLECSRGDRLLFSNLNFSLSAGNALLITGANGSGKTTLLRTLAGLLPPDQGEVHWQDSSIHHCASAYRSQLAFIGHKIGVKLGLTVLENLQLTCTLAKPLSVGEVQPILRTLQLEKYRLELAQNLSAGQRQRLALARLLLVKAKLWILDEPFTALDQSGVEIIKTQLGIHLRQGGMAIMTSHQAISLPTIALQQLAL